MPRGFDPEGQDLSRYETPEWFRDAKLGIFVHWGVYSVPAFGDEWYGHWMYEPDSKSWAGDDIYSYHREHYPSEFGYKDFIPKWKAERFDAGAWAQLFREAGARYVVPVAMHHDSFALYDSRLTPWKSTAMGPGRDLIAELERAVRERGMYFGLSNHYAENWWFFRHIEGRDTADPANDELYNRKNKLSEEHLRRWYAFSAEQIDVFRPDLFYYDFEIAKDEFAELRRKIAAYYYNKQTKWGKGVVLNYKYGAFADGEAVLDVERGQLAGIRELPWQACTSISNKSWGYIENDSFKSAETVIATLVDIVSKNGCMLLNVGPRADGTIPQEQADVLKRLGEWLRANGEAIYETRPWLTYGEGPTSVGGEALSERENAPFTCEDIRFTQSKDERHLYAIVMAPPSSNQVWIRSLRREAADDAAVERVTLLDHGEVAWSRQEEGLHVELPPASLVGTPLVLRITLA